MSNMKFQGRSAEWLAEWIYEQVQTYDGQSNPPADVSNEVAQAVNVLRDHSPFPLRRGEIFDGNIRGGKFRMRLWADPAAAPLGIGYEVEDLSTAAQLQYQAVVQQFGQQFRQAVAQGGSGQPTRKDDTMNRSCMTCPSYITASDHRRQIDAIGKALGVDWCATHQIPLDSQNSNTQQGAAILLAAAKGCPSYGEPPKEGEAITTPLGTVEGTFPPRPDDAEVPASCSACRFHVPQSTMLTQLGLPLAGCARKGDAILPGKEIAAAKQCPTGIIGFDAEANMNKLRLEHPYLGNITLIQVEDPDAPTTPPVIVEPTTYPTDAPVSDEDTAAGIRAWRRITDPDDAQRSVLMPIFDRSRFDEIEAAKIPQTGDDEAPELYRDHQGILYKALVLWRHLGETPALNGVPGVGKTEFFRYAAWMMQLPFERISITGSTEVDDLQGRFVLEGGETRFHYGRVPAAWQRPCVIVVDEPNVGPPEVWQFLRPLTDNSKQLVVDANKGERIARNPHCFLGMAFNPSWDMRNVGTHEISDADGSRLMHIAVPEPDEKLERRIIAERCLADGYTIPASALDAILKIAADVRALAKEDAFPIHWGTRQQIKVGRSSQWFTLEQAYRLAAGDLIDPESCEQLMVIVKSHTPKSKAKDTGK